MYENIRTCQEIFLICNLIGSTLTVIDMRYLLAFLTILEALAAISFAADAGPIGGVCK